MQNYQEKNAMSPIAAGITGLIVGIAGTAAVALSDKDTRAKAAKKATELKDGLSKLSNDLMQDTKQIREKVAEKEDAVTAEFSEKEKGVQKNLE
jgi:hypothetical protein